MPTFQLELFREYVDSMGALIEADEYGEVFTEADVRLHLEVEEMLDALED
jgi:hypothetical protein